MAGPPFRTDDPETVDNKHWEFYVATAFSDNVGAASGTAPHFEINYGIVPDIMVHLILPFGFNRIHGGSTAYGFGDLELGVKYRFVNIEDAHFIGTFPLIEAPTGDNDRGLREGHTRFLFPSGFKKIVANGQHTAVAAGGEIQAQTIKTSGLLAGSTA